MPIYQFHCHKCGDHFEDFRNLGEKKETGKCLSCGSDKIERVAVLNTDDCGCGCGCSSPGENVTSAWEEVE